MREILFTMKMSEEERRRADALAEHYGLTLAALFRFLLKEKEREVAATSKPARKGRK